MLARLRGLDYPRQFWIMVCGMLLVSIGSSMWWPFITIHLKDDLGVPLTQVTLLFTLNSAAGLVATSFIGPAVDRFGRRAAMILGLTMNGLALGLMGVAHGLGAWALALTLTGMFQPMYRVAADAMVADLIPQKERANAYSVTRMSNNLGIAIGPAIGGFVTAISYSLAFFAASAASLMYVLIVVLFLRETLQRAAPATARSASESRGYGPVFRDRRFLAFCIIMIIATIPSPLLWMLMPVYAKANYGVVEQQAGFIMSTNAIMVVLFQVAVTRWSSRYPNLRVLALGAFLYAIGVGSVALGAGFWAFWMSMVVLTFGELLLVPTGTAYAANSAPPEMRGRYMGLYGLTWSVAFGIGPVLGGWLNDNISPAATWVGGLVVGLVAVVGFLALQALQGQGVRRVEQEVHIDG
ncbi:MAG: MDR family MFS transporter [Nitrososphaerales archaeon]